mmetsp:Transcript_42799/g.100338  ORF Transcript_42799/g.100338 Transcript_42799/m.100338 type:complete len:977 (+) Transcript_42799:309-3239(+)
MQELLVKTTNNVIGTLSRTGGAIAGAGRSDSPLKEVNLEFKAREGSYDLTDPLTIALADSLGLADTFTDMLSESGSLNESRRDLRKMKRLMVLQGLIDRDPGPACDRCDAHKSMYAVVQKRFYHELEHLRRGIEQLLHHLAKYVTPGHFNSIKNKLNINVRFLTPHPGSDDEEGKAGHRDSVVSRASYPVGSDEDDDIWRRSAELETENDKLVRERSELLSELAELRRRLQQAQNAGRAPATSEAPCQTDMESAASPLSSFGRMGMLSPVGSSGFDTLSASRGAADPFGESGSLAGGSTLRSLGALPENSSWNGGGLGATGGADGGRSKSGGRKSKADGGSSGKERRSLVPSSGVGGVTASMASKEALLQEQDQLAKDEKLAKEREQAAARLSRTQRDLERNVAEKERLQKALEEDRARFQKELEALRAQLQACHQVMQENGLSIPGKDYPIDGAEGGGGPGGKGRMAGAAARKSLRDRHREAMEREAEEKAKKAAEEAERIKAEGEKVPTEDKGVGPGPGGEEDAVKVAGKSVKRPTLSSTEPLVDTFYKQKVRTHPTLGLGGGAGGAAALANSKSTGLLQSAATIARTEGLFPQTSSDKDLGKDLLCAKCGAALFDETAADLKFLKAKAQKRAAEGTGTSLLDEKLFSQTATSEIKTSSERRSSNSTANSEAVRLAQLKVLADKVKDLEALLEDKGKEVRELHRVIANRKQKDTSSRFNQTSTQDSFNTTSRDYPASGPSRSFYQEESSELVKTLVLPDDQSLPDGSHIESRELPPSHVESRDLLPATHSESRDLPADFGPDVADMEPHNKDVETKGPETTSQPKSIALARTESFHRVAAVMSTGSACALLPASEARSVPELPKASVQATVSPKPKGQAVATPSSLAQGSTTQPTRVMSEGVVMEMSEEHAAPPAPDVEPYLIHLWDQRPHQRAGADVTRPPRHDLLGVGAVPHLSPRPLSGVTTTCYPLAPKK